MSTLGYYKDPYSDEERSKRLYKEGLKHKAKEKNQAKQADTVRKNQRRKSRKISSTSNGSTKKQNSSVRGWMNSTGSATCVKSVLFPS